MKLMYKKNAELKQCLKDILDAFWDMSPLEFAQSRGHSHMSDEIGDEILERARELIKDPPKYDEEDTWIEDVLLAKSRKLIKEPEPSKDGHIFYQRRK